MTDFLVVAGITIPVDEAGSPSQVLVRGGTSSRAYLGNLRSTYRYEKREWKFTTQEITQAVLASIVTAVTLGTQVTCSGNALGGNVTCEVEVQEMPYFTAVGGDGLNFMRRATLLLREV